MVLRDLGLEKSSPVVTPVAKRSKSEELLLLAGATPVNAEDTTLYGQITCLWTVQTCHLLQALWHEG